MKIVETKKEVVIKSKKTYIAEDGKKFDSEKKCLEYEEDIKKDKEIKETIKKARERFKFKKIEIFNVLEVDMSEFDVVFVNSESDLVDGAIKCYYPTSRYGRIIEIDPPWEVTYPCWVVINEIDYDSSTRYTSTLKEVYDGITKTYQNIELLLSQ